MENKESIEKTSQHIKTQHIETAKATLDIFRLSVSNSTWETNRHT